MKETGRCDLGNETNEVDSKKIGLLGAPSFAPPLMVF